MSTKFSKSEDGNMFKHAACALGWFSLALGAAEIFLPRKVSRIAGIRNQPLLLRALGMREIVSGLGILTQKSPKGQAAWMWSRVAGDTMDLALLGAALGKGRNRKKVAMAAAAVAGVTALDLLTSGKLSANGASKPSVEKPNAGNTVRKSIIIGRSAEEIYAFWRNFENLPRFMRKLKNVTVLDSQRSRWTVQTAMGKEVSWEAMITQDIPNEQISWRTIGDAPVTHSGRVLFERAPGGRGTMVILEMRYDPPGGMLGGAMAKLTRDNPTQMAADALRCFKMILETGNIVSIEGQPAGRKQSTSKRFDLPMPEPVSA